MRRSTTAAIAILAVGLAMIGVTRPRAEDEPPPVAQDPVPGSAALRSSTRGVVTLALDLDAQGGQPFDAGDLSGTYPNAAIGRIDLRQHGRTSWCTGTLIDADTVLTAGHCVHEGGTGLDHGWSTQVVFTPGAEGRHGPFGSCDARELFTLPGWYDTGNEYQDLGLIQLDCTIGDTVGWFGYRGMAELTNVPVHVRGYPGDKASSSLRTARDRVRLAQPLMAFYRADTHGGQSGSPVFNFRRCNGVAGPCILAVHAYGVHRDGLAHARNNHGPRLTQARAALIEAAATDHG